MIRRALSSPADLTRVALSPRGAPVIWVFHDVRNAAWFQRCVDEIASAQEVLPLVEMSLQPSRKTCAITFDDGLRSVLDVAVPVLEERGLPHTVFVCTDVLTGGPVPWFLRLGHLVERIGLERVRERWGLTDPAFRGRQELISGMKQVSFHVILAGLEELEIEYEVSPPTASDLFLSAQEVRDLASAGTTIGSHTHRHPILALLSVHDQRFEIEESARVIEGITGRRPIEFAYPNGTPLDFDATTTAVLRASGMQLAVTTTQRPLSSHDDLFALPRIGLSDGDSSLRRALKTVVPSLSRSATSERRLRSLVPR